MASTTARSPRSCCAYGATAASAATTRVSTRASAPPCRPRNRPTCSCWETRPASSRKAPARSDRREPQGAAMANGSEFIFVVPAEVLPGAARGAGPVQLRARSGQDVVRLTIANGPVLVLAPETASAVLAPPGPRAPPSAPGTVNLRVQWGPATLAGFEVLSDVMPELPLEMASEEAARLLARKVDAQVDTGLYALEAGRFDQPLKSAGRAPLAPVPAATDGGPLLVLVHGTFSETHGTFGKLWTAHPDQVSRLFEAYGQRVYGFDHRTLEESPVRNALALVAALPQGARLHLLTHSRGGLVAEVLARACSAGTPTRAELDAAAPDDAADLEQLFRDAHARKLQVERIVRVACPARGTLLASRRLDAYLSVLTWALQLAGQEVLGVLLDFLHGIAKKRADPSVLPGLAAMMPESPFIQWLDAQQEPVAGELRVVAGDVQGDSLVAWIKALVADAYYWTDNDFVVHTRAMYGGVARAPGAARFLLDRGGKVSHFG